MPIPNPKMFLFEFPVKPGLQNPHYWTMEYAVLEVYIIGVDLQEAGNRAHAIATLLNYELGTPQQGYEIADELPPETSLIQRTLDTTARWNGIAFFLRASKVGSDIPATLKFAK